MVSGGARRHPLMHKQRAVGTEATPSNIFCNIFSPLEVAPCKKTAQRKQMRMAIMPLCLPQLSIFGNDAKVVRAPHCAALPPPPPADAQATRAQHCGRRRPPQQKRRARRAAAAASAWCAAVKKMHFFSLYIFYAAPAHKNGPSPPFFRQFFFAVAHGRPADPPSPFSPGCPPGEAVERPPPPPPPTPADARRRASKARGIFSLFSVKIISG